MPTLNLGRVGFVNKGAYIGGTTAYKINDIVVYNSGIYACIQAHSTSHLPTDVLYWQKWTGNSADSVANTPAGNISSVTVQGAIDELDTEKQPISPYYTGIKSVDLASASTVNIGAASGEYIHITGTTTITAFDIVAAGISRTLVFDGSLTLTHNAITLKLPTSANILTSAGDSAQFVSEGSGNWKCISYQSTLSNPTAQDFRLTLTSGTPVTTSDVTAATTLYLAPYKGNKISLYNGASWDVITSAQISILVPATTSQMYDVFVYSSSGAPVLELTAWTNDTTRATALTYQDGILVKSGANTRRYIGSFRTTTVSGQTEDSLVKRYVWNYYNRVRRVMFRQESTASWTYTTATYRQANANTANQLDFVIGVSEDAVSANIMQKALSSSASGTGFNSGIGLDSTSAIATGSIEAAVNPYLANAYIMLTPIFDNIVAPGRHYLTWLEYSVASGTTTWIGSTSSGIKGSVLG